MTGITEIKPDKTDLRDKELPQGTIRIVQITDTHLYADPAGKLLGVNTLSSFHQVIDEIAATDWPADHVLATGDLVHDASPSGYRDLAKTLDRFGIPVHCLPGNHDVPTVMREHLRGEQVDTGSIVDAGSWRFVMLDSVIIGDPGGRLAESELALLQDALDSAPHHVLICLHHQPVPVGSAWMDTMALENADAFFRIIDASDKVRGILWGHVHQTFDAMRGPIRMLASPSTCVQFVPKQDAFGIDEEPPGFRLLALTPDGGIHSQVMRSREVPSGLDVASLGY